MIHKNPEAEIARLVEDQRHTVEEATEAVEAALAADREAALRDVFAAAALGALIARGHFDPGHPHGVACDAYRHADAMMHVRK
jgi:hypothetical protein